MLWSIKYSSGKWTVPAPMVSLATYFIISSFTVSLGHFHQKRSIADYSISFVSQELYYFIPQSWIHIFKNFSTKAQPQGIKVSPHLILPKRTSWKCLKFQNTAQNVQMGARPHLRITLLIICTFHICKFFCSEKLICKPKINTMLSYNSQTCTE